MPARVSVVAWEQVWVRQEPALDLGLLELELESPEPDAWAK